MSTVTTEESGPTGRAKYDGRSEGSPTPTSTNRTLCFLGHVHTHACVSLSLFYSPLSVDSVIGKDDVRQVETNREKTPING